MPALKRWFTRLRYHVGYPFFRIGLVLEGQPAILWSSLLSYLALDARSKEARNTCAQAHSLRASTTTAEVIAAQEFFGESSYPMRVMHPYFSKFRVHLCRRTQRALNNLEAHVATTLTSLKFREQCLTEIKALTCPCSMHHDAIIYDPSQEVSPDEEVVFTVTWRDRSHPMCIRYCLNASVLANHGYTSVVHTPRWAYNILKHSMTATSRASAPMTYVEVKIGPPSPVPGGDVLVSALALWSNDDSSPYYHFHVALEAAQLLA